MVQKYFDDEKIDGVKVVSEPNPGAFDTEGITATYDNKKDASLEREQFTVLLELTGKEGVGNDRQGLDIVIVLDVSSSMRGKKLTHMKIATKFLVKKLSPVDRLSVVTFCEQAHRLCPLSLMTQDAQSHIEGLIDFLKEKRGTNITAGLEEAVQVLNDRRFTEGRNVAIMLMSDGNPSRSSYDGSKVSFGDVPVHTFGLGQDYHPQVLINIAARSIGGTFNTSDVENTTMSNLSIAFAQCLAGLLNVVVHDLTLIVTKLNSDIEMVSAGKYTAESRNDSEGSVTVPFGNLYSRETRNILVDLVLHKVTEPKGTDILEFTYLYKKVYRGKKYDAPPVTITVTRTETPSGQEIPKVLNEKARQDTAKKMKDARILADHQKFDDAKGQLNDAAQNLKRNELNQSDPLIMGLQAEVKQFTKLMETPEIYEKLGRAFAFASELSHALQRACARGNVNELRLFATKAMDQLTDQVQKYEKYPNAPVSTTAQDKENRTKDDPKPVPKRVVNPAVAAIAEVIGTHLGDAIKSLKAIQDLINKIG